jgi:hypothetical protein
MSTLCSLPLLPRKLKRTSDPSTSTCSSRRVVSPNDSFVRAYSALPIRINVQSSRRTTVASTFSRGRYGSERSWSTRARRSASAAPKAASRPYLCSSLNVRQCGW